MSLTSRYVCGFVRPCLFLLHTFFSFLYLASLMFPSEYTNFDFLAKISKLRVIKNTEKKHKKNLVLTSRLHLTFSYSSSLFELHSGLILLTRVKNPEGQQMLHRNRLEVFKTLSFAVDNKSISGQILCSFGGNTVMKKSLFLL